MSYNCNRDSTLTSPLFPSNLSRCVLTFVEFALGVGQGKWSAVFDQFQETWGLIFGDYAGGAAAEGVQFPSLARFNGGAPGGGKAHAGKICERKNNYIYISLYYL